MRVLASDLQDHEKKDETPYVLSFYRCSRVGDDDERWIDVYRRVSGNGTLWPRRISRGLEFVTAGLWRADGDEQLHFRYGLFRLRSETPHQSLPFLMSNDVR